MATRIGIGLVSAFVGAVAALLWLRPPPASSVVLAPAPADDLGPRVRALLDERDALAADVDVLRAALDARPSEVLRSPALPSPTPASEPAAPPAAAAQLGRASPLPIPPSALAGLALPPDFRGFDDRSLYAVGVEDHEVERLRAVFEEFSLDAGSLFSKAQAEGWLMSPRYQKGREELRQRYQEAREEVGDEAFDRLLYGARKPNRVILSHVPERSVAGQADLRPADLLVSYDGARIFTRADLATAIGSGRVGETVRVEVLRDSRPIVVWLPREDLGASMASIRQPPLPAR